jgi:hypothetical protein
MDDCPGFPDVNCAQSGRRIPRARRRERGEGSIMKAPKSTQRRDWISSIRTVKPAPILSFRGVLHLTGKVDADILIVMLYWDKRPEDVSSNDRFRNGWRKSGGESARRAGGREGESGRPVVGGAGTVCRLDFRSSKAHPDGGHLNVFLGRHSVEGAGAPEAPNGVRTAPARSGSRTRYVFSLMTPRFTCRGIPPAGAAAVACRRTEGGSRRRRLWIWMPPLRYA